MSAIPHILNGGACRQPKGRHRGASMRSALASAVFSLLAGFGFAGFLPPSAAVADEITATFSAYNKDSTLTVDHSSWDRLLKAHVKPGDDGVNRVDYKGFKQSDHAKLKAYVKTLEGTPVSKLNRPEQLAFWINLYNSKTIDIVLDHYPVQSIRDISIESSLVGFLRRSVGAGGPWKAEVVRVEGMNLSLDHIEHNILRPVFQDPRIHYAVNCASYGCPNLQFSAFTGANVDASLEAAARNFINHARGIKVEDGKVTASSIYNWFQSDFGGTAAGVLDHVRRYASPELHAALADKTTIDAFDYDWRLNDVAP